LQTAGLVSTRCAICDTPDNSTEMYPANFERESLTPDVFSARRLPDRIHYRLVKCKTCGLVRSDPVAPSDTLAELYRQSAFTYAQEVTNLRKTYGRSLARLKALGAHKNTLLEVGCGNGFFLEEALKQGYVHVLGVEPSQEAVEQASPVIRPSILCTVMQPGLFERAQIDVICLFQVLDHIADPKSLISECFKVLKPGGLILCINHDITSWSARFLKERSPIIDVEHTYLYSPTTLSRLYEAQGFRVIAVGSVRNYYSAHYLMRLVPLPVVLKSLVLGFLYVSSLGRVRISVPLGNIEIIAQKVPQP
jgi:SAM-dependent methyltransferase